ncbi:alpha-galactosidase [bacterium]|nr:alpha-galactosidase [bacterium]
MFNAALSRVAAAVLTVLFVVVNVSCSGAPGRTVLEDGVIRVEVTGAGGLVISRKAQDRWESVTSGSEAAFRLKDISGGWTDFRVSGAAPLSGLPAGQSGLKLSLTAPDSKEFAGVSLEASLCMNQASPGVVLARTDILGLSGAAAAACSGSAFYRLQARADLGGRPAAAPWDYYLFQGMGYKWGQWYTMIHLSQGYNAPNNTVRNIQGQTGGGGLPVLYLWTRAAGLLLAHVDTVHRVCAFPVAVRPDSTVELALTREAEFSRPDSAGRVIGLPVMLGVFQGDYFNALRAWANELHARGMQFARAPKGAYEPIWCGWGFYDKFVPNDILKSLPAVKKLGIPVVVVDDGWYVSFGRWPLRPEKFPHGESDMRALVDSIHAGGFKAKLWWVPGSVHERDPLYKEHPEWLLLDKDGKTMPGGWHSVYLCPAYAPVVEQQLGLVRRFMIDWNYDAFKMDGDHLDVAPPCYNPAHHHARPEESCEAQARLFAAIQALADSIKPGCVLEVCECGTPPQPYKFPYYNQQVTSDPTSSDQTRARIKMFRALFGSAGAPYGDHVELSTGPDKGPEWRDQHGPGKDFASTLALGGIIGTKFTELGPDDVVRTWDNNKGILSLWQKWFALNAKLHLYEGEYENLYDIAWDSPETHVVARGDTLYYAVFAEGFDGALPLRGLQPGRAYNLTDYENGDTPLGEVTGGPQAVLNAQVKEHLLIRAAPR